MWRVPKILQFLSYILSSVLTNGVFTEEVHKILTPPETLFVVILNHSPSSFYSKRLN